jgi:radical SAM superfamily enzyme YgiQ (UPF0313 family)
MSLGLELVTTPLGQLILASQLENVASKKVFNLDITPFLDFWEYFNTVNNRITVGLTVTSGNIRNAFDLAKILKREGVKVIIGGPEISMAGSRILEYHDFIDGIVMGAGENVINDILSEKPNPNFVTRENYKTIRSENYLKIAFNEINIDYNLLYDLDKLKGVSYLWGNDCSLAYNRCYFCGRLALGRGYRKPEKIWNELYRLYNKDIKFYYNTTDSITINKKAFRDFVLSKPRNMINDKHRVFVNANQVDDFIIESLKPLNGVAVIGFESFGNFDNTQKLGASVKNNLEVIERLANNKLTFVLSFVLGLPGENLGTLEMTNQGIIKIVKMYGELIDAIHISPLLITTGSKAYNDLFSFTHIQEKYKYHSYPYDPIEMSDDYFSLFCKISRKDALIAASKTISVVNSLCPNIKIGLKGVLQSELDSIIKHHLEYETIN